VTLVVAVDHRFDELDVERAVLVPLGAEVYDARGLERAQVLEMCSEADAVLLGARFRFDRDAIAALSRCKVIVRYGIGYDNVDTDAALGAGIQVAYVPDYCIEEVANHAIAMVLALNRRLFELDALIREGHWGIPSGLAVRRLSSSVLGVVGFGRIGEAVGRRAGALGMKVIAFDPLRPDDDIIAACATPATLDELLARSDYVTLHAPPSGAGPLLGAQEIGRLRSQAAVINVGRAGLIDEVVLVRALRNRELAGAALDVTAEEPLLAPSPLLDVPNLILTPHSAWYSREAVFDLRDKAAHEVARVLSGEPPRYAVTPSA
jgi:D-3-phosphoglycerate dehydrogenase